MPSTMLLKMAVCRAPVFKRAPEFRASSLTSVERSVKATVSAGSSSLAYDAASETYSYVWKTDKAWKGSCRQLVLGFADGSFQRANFMFK